MNRRDFFVSGAALLAAAVTRGRTEPPPSGVLDQYRFAKAKWAMLRGKDGQRHRAVLIDELGPVQTFEEVREEVRAHLIRVKELGPGVRQADALHAFTRMWAVWSADEGPELGTLYDLHTFVDFYGTRDPKARLVIRATLGEHPDGGPIRNEVEGFPDVISLFGNFYA